ncbi:MAG: type II toxin-antitoxin system VapC family toxin [Alphaproteobacteria bacterium]|nr:type II toxin-antitoxin system VapC family toxin [Alphaproteobacteria bacterium]MBL7098034.1 type II toxin-antitoxin system VapC family toxin [Alphaproteobacteria bacterium]
MSGPILLDTCAIMWLVEGLLGEPGETILAERYAKGETIYVSPFTAWEIGAKASRGGFRSALTPEAWLTRAVALPGIAFAGLSPRLLLDSWSLPGRMIKDPADRIVAATAREYGYTVMTRDAALLDYGKQGYLSVVEC